VDGLDIAVVGMAGRFPGADTVEELWRNVVLGAPVISTFSGTELGAAGVPPEEHSHPDYVPAYGALDDVAGFDAEFFGYSPRDARIVDPQQRLFLECAWQALERSGHLDDDLVGVYAATSASTYLLRNLLAGAPASEYELMLANDKDSVATRVAYHLDLRGPAVCVQTACSSSLVAVHQAAQALLAGECDVALAGAAHVRVPVRSGYRYEQGGIMSRDGRCRPFAADASGTVGGDGVAAVVLRRLSDAVRDRDTIYAVIKGSAINNDGRAKVGYTAPSVDGQVAVIRMAQRAAGVDPATVGYVETHGTGTALGDQIEFRALTTVFPRTGSRALGAVKSVVGHLDVAAGITGLIKACLAVHHGVLPPSPYLTEPHPDLGMATSGFVAHPRPAPWADAPRRAGVSSFGIGGTNAHVVLEQAPVAAAAESRRDEHLLLVSARTRAALSDACRRLRDHLATSDVPLADVAYTTQTTRRRFSHRLAVVCGDRDEAVAALSSTKDALANDSAGRSVAFLFPGQGSQYPGMGADLYRTDPVYREEVDRCADLLRPHLELDLRAVLSSADQLRQTWLTQPALFTVEYALARSWLHRGIAPAAMAGHSIGEYVAACLAGVFDLPDALAIVAARGRLMQSMPPGAMLSVALPAQALREWLPEGVDLAASNAPGLSVAAGPAQDVDALAESLRAEGVKCKPLHTSHAFHSAMMSPVVDEFAAHVARFPAQPPSLPVLSNVTGDWLTDADAVDPAYWARQLREPVRFDEGARRLLAGRHVPLEVGPGRTLTALVHQQPLAAGLSAAVSLGGPRDPRATTTEALGQLWLGGVDIDWRREWTDERRRLVALPPYPFQHERHWVDAPGTEPAPARAPLEPEPDLSVAETIQQIWSELLGIPDVRPDQDFFSLGGHSLLGTKVVARIREALDVDLPASALFQTPTIAGLAATVAQLRADTTELDLPPGLLAEITAMSPDELRAQLAKEMTP
jgi:acyl transferase domain-containing protein